MNDDALPLARRVFAGIRQLEAPWGYDSDNVCGVPITADTAIPEGTVALRLGLECLIPS